MKSIAKDLWLHRIAGTSIKDKSLLASLAFTSENDAYAFQFSQLASQPNPQSNKHAGWKVGATNDAGQKRFGLTQPFLGPLFKDHLKQGESIKVFKKEMVIRGIEAEIAFVIGKDVPRSSKPFDLQNSLEYISHYAPSIEVCATRLDPPPSSGLTLIADFAGNGSVLVSKAGMTPFSKDTFDINSVIDVQVVDKSDSKVIAKGSSKEVLGNPLNSFVWLLNMLNKLQATHNPKSPFILERNSTIITGATCGLLPITKTCNYTVQFNGLGKSTTLEFAYNA